MLTINQPFPVIKAGIGGVVTLATGFYGTITLLHAVDHGDTKTAVNHSTTAPKPDASADVTTKTSSHADAKTSAATASAWKPATGATSTPTTVNNYTPPTTQSTALTTGTSNTSSVQVQPTQNSTAATSTQAPVTSTSTTTDPNLIDSATGFVGSTLNVLP